MPRKSHELVFPNQDGVELSARLELPAGPPHAHAVFAHCFTCSKDSAAATRVSRALCRRGVAVLRFDFTGLGGSDGDFANTSFSSNVADLVAAADFLRAEHQAPRILLGHSLGGAAVLAAAGDVPEVAAVVTINAPGDPAHVEDLLADDLDTIREQGSARVAIAGRAFTIQRHFLEDLEQERFAAKVAGLGRALLVLHSPQDEVVPIEHARRIYEAARHPKSFVSLDGADHLLRRPADAEYVGEVVAAWASRYVPSEAPGQDGSEAPAEGEVRVVASGPRGLAQEIRAGHHVLTADEPLRAGGEDTGPTPYDLLLAALGACTSMTLQMYARHKGWPLEGVSVLLRHERVHARDCESCESEEGRVDRIRRELRVEGALDADQRARLTEIAERCPVHRTLIGEKEILTRLAD